MMRAKCLAAAAMMSMSLSALAVETTYEFDSVSELSYDSVRTTISGVLINDSVPTTVTGVSGHSRCDALLGEMIKNPGMYILSVTLDVMTQPGPPATLLRCTLKIKP